MHKLHKSQKLHIRSLWLVFLTWIFDIKPSRKRRIGKSGFEESKSFISQCLVKFFVGWIFTYEYTWRSTYLWVYTYACVFISDLDTRPKDPCSLFIKVAETWLLLMTRLTYGVAFESAGPELSKYSSWRYYHFGPLLVHPVILQIFLYQKQT